MIIVYNNMCFYTKRNISNKEIKFYNSVIQKLHATDTAKKNDQKANGS